MNATADKLIQQQISDAVNNYLPRCCGQCKYETGAERCQLDPDIDTENSNLRRHPDCPLGKKGGKK